MNRKTKFVKGDIVKIISSTNWKHEYGHIGQVTFVNPFINRCEIDDTTWHYFDELELIEEAKIRRKKHKTTKIKYGKCKDCAWWDKLDDTCGNCLLAETINGEPMHKGSLAQAYSGQKYVVERINSIFTTSRFFGCIMFEE